MALFASVKRVELAAAAWEELQQQDASAEEEQVQVMIGEVNPLTTVPLPTEQERKDATKVDSDLSLVLQVLQPGADPLQKAMLEDKRHYNLWKQQCFTATDGIVYFFEEGRGLMLQQLRMKV
eukprot:15339224-Ditylum_brightwellii.AAC.1